LIIKAGFKVTEAHTDAVSLIQRFGLVLNMNLHFHALFIDGVFSPKSNGELRFHRIEAPTAKVLTACAARCKQSQPGKKMSVAPASLARLEDSRCMGAAFRR